MDDVLVATRSGHVHGVDVDLREYRSGSGDSRRNVDLANLAHLANVTASNVPDDIDFDRRPPEAFDDESAGGEGTAVSEIVVARLENTDAIFDGDD